MARSSKEITSLFLISCALSVLTAFFIPSVKVHFFVPPLIMAFYAFPEKGTLWRAFYIGCFLDILQFSPKIGFYAFSYTLCTLALLRLKKFFFQDDPKIVAFLTYIFSSLLTVIEGALILFLEGESPIFSIRWIFFDCFIMPCIDVVYAMLLTTQWKKIKVRG